MKYFKLVVFQSNNITQKQVADFEMSNITCTVAGNNSSNLSVTTANDANVDLDGYSLPVYGLADGTFYTLHIPALICICLSFLCATSSIVYSFYHQHYSTFFKWTKSERFVIYMALCDALFNVAHFSDHIHIVITKTFPKPKNLCAFYGFMLTEFITAQSLMVNVVAINVFRMIYFRKKLNFGCRDYRLLLYIFGVPALGGAIVGAVGQLGPNGVFCFFDGVKGKPTNIFFTTGLLMTVLITNIILYLLSWYRMHKDTRQLKHSLGRSSQALRLSHRAAKTMSFFIAAYVIQWSSMSLYGIWQVFDDVPQLLFNFITTIPNLGGFLNGIVLIIILKRKKDNPKSGHKSSDEVDMPQRRTDTTIDKSEAYKV